MLVSMKWLKEYFPDLKVTPEELADKMSRSGIEVEAVTRMSDGLKKIVVGHVLSCEPHPDSDHLSVCQVNVGEAEPYQIVCGAPNVGVDQKVIVALPGSRIAGNVKIKKSKMRGVVSQGMLCSLEELGFAEALVPKEMAEGIYLLPAEAVAGEVVFPWLDMEDAVIELSITPNRADALSMNGVAYEVGAIYGQTPVFQTQELHESATAIAEKMTATVENPQRVPHYEMRLIENVTIQPSPQWVQNRLMNAGIRPINNVVDVTNYILLEYGQPLHAFDYERLASKEIVVRQAQDTEKLVTLDGEERQLSTEDLVVTNGVEPVALAGVMGGEATEIWNQTKTVALEAALFDPLAVRKTARKFNLRSESSSRFEKGINQGAIRAALDAAAEMITQLAGGEVLQGVASACQVVAENQEVAITLSRLNGALGTALSEAEVGQIFRDLGFAFKVAEQHFTVSIPPRRWDITIEADLVEEVARIYGYDALPSTLPEGTIQIGRLTKQQEWVREARSVLEANGLKEAISYALTTPEKAQHFVEKNLPQVALQWPMSEDRAVLRTSLLPGLLEDVAYNQKRKATAVPFYEVGKVFVASPQGELPIETTHLAIALSGLTQAASWQDKAQATDFYELKGILEALLAHFQLDQMCIFEATSAYPDFHPGRTALLKERETGEVVGVFGQVHPTTAKEFSIKETYVAEVNVEKLVACTHAQIAYQAVSKYPAVQRDIALLVDETVSQAAIMEVIVAKGGRLLKASQLFDVYQGPNLGSGKKSLAYSLTFENAEATLVDEEINRMVEKIQAALVSECGAEIR